LTDAALQIAAQIVAAESQQNTPIAIMCDQDSYFVRALFGALLAGKSYVPLDSRRSAAWNQRVLTTTGCQLIWYSKNHHTLTQALAVAQTLAVDSTESIPPQSGFNPILQGPDETACVYFTSGTTGKPKGVIHNHRSLIHNALRYSKTLQITADDRLSLIQAPIFSGTQSTLFACLICGATLASYDIYVWPLVGLAEWINKHRLTMFHSVPALFRTLARPAMRYDSIRIVRLEGDRANDTDVSVFRTHFSDGCTLVNGLGATECGLIRQHFMSKETPCAQGDLPLGGPVPDMHVEILDEHGAPAVTGEIGEVSVRSHYLATGYLLDPELTDRQFGATDDGMRSYRTGDTGWLDDTGCLRLVARKARQFKINGQSIDSNKIETALAELQSVQSAKVNQQEDSTGNTQLIAYLIGSSTVHLSLELMRQQLGHTLASYEIPAYMIWLNEWPLSLEGKIDYAALPKPKNIRPVIEAAYVPPQHAIEIEIVTLWEGLLDIRPIGIRDDFLLIGGDSLKAMRLLVEVENRWYRCPTFTEFFVEPTIESLANWIRK
jgi:acyl-coenzyme A synthetase/AMP-(fatty) acid ligase/aryl carrier-like protein